MRLHEWESLLPHWLGKPEFQWIQWVYALWQIIRCNPLALFALSYLPFCLCQMYKKKTVVVLADNTDYLVPWSPGARGAHLRKNAHRLKNIEILWDRSIEWCYAVKYCGHYHFTPVHYLGQLAECAKRHGDISENIIFVETLLTVSGSWAVGKQISHTEAYEKVFSHTHLSRGAAIVIPSIFDYVDLRSKLWGVLSTVPILLQARNYNRFSNLFSLVIILLDFSRHILYKFYDRIFVRIVDFVKLNVFKERQGLYDFFSIFSNRWRYTDTVKKHAYVAKKGGKMKIKVHCKLEALDDLQVENWEKYTQDPNDENICMEVVDGRAYVSRMINNAAYADATLNKPVYVP